MDAAQGTVVVVMRTRVPLPSVCESSFERTHSLYLIQRRVHRVVSFSPPHSQSCPLLLPLHLSFPSVYRIQLWFCRQNQMPKLLRSSILFLCPEIYESNLIEITDGEIGKLVHKIFNYILVCKGIVIRVTVWIHYCYPWKRWSIFQQNFFIFFG